MKNCLFILLCFMLSAFSAVAQTGAKGNFVIKGQVVDSLTNETVPYATLSIALQNNPQKSLLLLACDIDGNFEASLKSAGKYILSMQSIGKKPAQKKFTLSAGKTTLNLGKLYMIDDNQRLDEVTVVAQKPLVKVEIDKLTYSLQDDPESQTNNTLDMLRKVPMITVDGNDEIQLQGSTNFKIYVNGKPSNMLSNNPSDVLKSMPASSVKDIEVITDPGAKYDAEGVGGIINIITTKNLFQGYTGTVRDRASTLGRFGGGAYVSAKYGKFGITANYNYNYNNSPWNESYSIREDYGTDSRAGSVLNQSGRSKNQGPFQFGYLEGSYEIDSLNLITVGANLFRGDNTSKTEYAVEMLGRNGSELLPSYSYNRNSRSTSVFGSTDINVDYQHSTHKKGELLTLSYRFSQSPNNSESYTELLDVVDYPLMSDYPQWTINDAATNEHTFQFDYTTPTWKNHTLEAGVKYIYRGSDSETDRRYYRDSIQDWESVYDANSDFRHNQHIYSAYLGYAMKFGKLGTKFGVRGEGTSLNVKYAYDPSMNFKTNYFDVVPNLTLSYQITQAQQVRVGYNMRIRRPGIRYLNPYINDTDPLNISYGNPNLDSEKSHNIRLNYSIFTQKFNMNFSGNYRFVNNSIEQYTWVNDQGISETTYGNIGRTRSVGAFLYASYSPIAMLRIFTNAGMNYEKLQSTEGNLANDGFSGRVFAGAQLTLPKDFRIDLNGGYFSPRINLQGKSSSMYFTGISLNKSFFDKKLTVSLSCNNPFWKTIKMESNTADDTFNMKTVSYNHARDFRLSVSYRFGSLKDVIKKVKRGISNDDSMGGENENGGGMQM